MAVVHGNSVGIFVNPTGGGIATAKLVACATNATFSLSNALVETNCKTDSSGALTDASTRHILAGNQTWSMTVEGLVDLTTGGANAESYQDLMEVALNRTEVDVVFSDEVTGNQQYHGKAYITSIDATAGVDDFVTYTCTLDGNGTLTSEANT